MTPRDIPNLISIFRILLVIPVAWLLLRERYSEALILFAIAGASDALDGYLAKRNQWITWLGGILDPLADKLLLLVCFIVLGYLGLMPLWLVAVVLLRDVVIVSGALVYHFRIARLEAEPTLISKLNTTLQIVLVLLVVFDQSIATPLDRIVDVFIYGVLATTLLSGVAYVVIWSRRARAAVKSRTS